MSYCVQSVVAGNNQQCIVFERSVVFSARWLVIWNKSVKSGAVQRELALRLHQTYSSRRGHRPQTTAAVFLLFLSIISKTRLHAAIIKFMARIHELIHVSHSC